MFGYYGSKSIVVDYYPKPKFSKIIESFAGSGRYALKYFDRDVLLVDKYDVIIKIWKWLQKCSEKDILGLPRLKVGENVDSFNWDCDEAKWLVGFIITGAPATPKKTASKWKTVIRPNTQNYKLKFIAKNLFKIKHWEFKIGSYDEIENEAATHFIDPPYSHGGEFYKFGSAGIDYAKLAEWCKSRRGQVIVCENTKADWLPFKKLSEMHGAKFRTTEAIWTNEKTVYDNEQLKMFHQ